MNYIESGWKTYEAQVIPRSAGSIQRQECRRAYFAGALGLYESILAFLEPGNEATDADLRRIQLVSEELQDFARGVLEGRE